MFTFSIKKRGSKYINEEKGLGKLGNVACWPLERNITAYRQIGRNNLRYDRVSSILRRNYVLRGPEIVMVLSKSPGKILSLVC